MQELKTQNKIPDKSEPSPTVNIYKLKLSLRLLNIGSLIFLGVIIGLPLFLLLTIAISILQSTTDLNPIGIGLLCLLVPIIILMSLFLLRQMGNVILQFFSYIKVSPEGLEQKFWPYIHIRCHWSDIDKVGKWLITDVLYLNSYEIIGPSIYLKKPFSLFRIPTQKLMALSSYQGWPDGQLAEDIRQFAPQLFDPAPDSPGTATKSDDEPTTPQIISADQDHPSGLSQDERLLAALAHASIFLSYAGFIVPIIILIVQQGKSAYAQFQASQALVWQLVMLMFHLLFGTCFAGAIFVPILIGPSLENETAIEAALGGMFLAIVVMIILMTVGYIAFLIYSIIGAIMTFQGKDFRYIIIGNRLGKSGISFPRPSQGNSPTSAL